MKQIFCLLSLLTLIVISCRKDDPPRLATISTTAVSNLTSSSVTSGGTISDAGNSNIIQRGIAWSTHAGPTVADSITNDGTGSGAFTSTLSTLRSHTTYYLRAYAINSAGTAYGNEISVTSLNGLPTITTVAITNIQPLSASTGGNVINDGGVPVTERGIVYGISPNPTILNSKINGGSGTGAFNTILSPLASQQTYYVRAYAVNSFGIVYGNQLQFNAASANTVTDIDGNVYPYITLCGKDWMAANLKTTHFRNGDSLTRGYLIPGFNWKTTTESAIAPPNNDISKIDSFGYYYNRYALRDSRGVCPTGWHIPTDDDWKTMEICQGMSSADAQLEGVYRGTIGPKLRVGGSSGLNLQLSGYLLVSTATGFYADFGVTGIFASSTQATATSNYYRGVAAPSSTDQAGVLRLYAGYAMAVRCVRD